MLPRGAPRLGVGGTIAVVAIVGLVAAGFGVLGGRPETPPAASGAVRPASAKPSQAAAPASPQVTPWVPCAESPASGVDVLLEVSGQPTPADVEVVAFSTSFPPFDATDQPGDATSPSGTPGDRVQVPIDVITDLWIVGGGCAVAWSIDLGEGDVLESQSNPSADPAVAAQNRFTLLLAPYAGGDYTLRAVLVFPDFVVRATWPIHVPAFDRSGAILNWGAVPVPVVEGCHLLLLLGSREPLDLNRCTDDLSVAPGTPIVVRSGERGVFEISGWSVDVGEMTCGHLSGLSFVAQPLPGCSVQGELVDGQAIFDAPAGAGTWTIAISACGLESVAVSPLPENRMCGTWYAEVEFRD